MNKVFCLRGRATGYPVGRDGGAIPPHSYPTICTLPSCCIPRITGSAFVLVNSTLSHRRREMGQLTPSNLSLLMFSTSCFDGGNWLAVVIDPMAFVTTLIPSPNSSAP